ncbi:hypothetical protein JCM6882_007540 [Rhodosporidiobolus microsporus]
MSSSTTDLSLALESFALGFTEEGFETLLQLKQAHYGYRSFDSVSSVPRTELEQLKKLSVHVGAGRQALETKEWQKASDELDSAIASMPFSTAPVFSLHSPPPSTPSNDARWWLASWKLEALRRLGKSEDLAFSKELLPLVPDDPRLRYIRTFALYQFGLIDEASKDLVAPIDKARKSQSLAKNAKYCSTAIEQDTKLLADHAELSLQLFLLGHANDAIRDANHCISLWNIDKKRGTGASIRSCAIKAWVLHARASLALDNLTPAIELLKSAHDGVYSSKQKALLFKELERANQRKAAREKEKTKNKAAPDPPPPAQTKDPYSIFGIYTSPRLYEVSALYKKLCLIYHPDKGGNDAKMKEINEAYEALKKVLV